jgi:hypothetical protein
LKGAIYAGPRPSENVMSYLGCHLIYHRFHTVLDTNCSHLMFVKPINISPSKSVQRHASYAVS